MESGQGIIAQMADDHSTPDVARRAETQPDGFRQSARAFDQATGRASLHISQPTTA